MIPGDIVVVQPESLEEAVAVWQEAVEHRQRPAYLGGGTELVTQGRDGKLQADVLIDTKRISATQGHRTDDQRGEMVFGSALRLSAVPGFPLLHWCARGVGDRTVRNSITLGGNICGMLAYREAVLPFLLLGGVAELYGPGGTRFAPMEEVFDKRMHLKDGELVVSFRVPAGAMEGVVSAWGTDLSEGGYGAVAAGAADRSSASGWYYRRRTQDSRIDYPLVTLGMVRRGDFVRVAMAGAWGYPRSAPELESLLEKEGVQSITEEAVRTVVESSPVSWKEDHRGSAAYRQAVALQGIMAGIEFLKGAS